MISSEEVYKIGRIGKPHGVAGEMLMHIDDDVFDRVEAEYIVVEIEGILVPFFISDYRFRNDQTVIISLEGIDSEQRARQLTHCNVFFPRRLADNDAEEVSLAMLVGFTIFDESVGRTIGTISGIDASTINTLFEIIDTDGNEHLIPAADELITDINMPDKIITMTLPEGLI